jgi:hypothetical protein
MWFVITFMSIGLIGLGVSVFRERRQRTKGRGYERLTADELEVKRRLTRTRAISAFAAILVVPIPVVAIQRSLVSETAQALVMATGLVVLGLGFAAAHNTHVHALLKKEQVRREEARFRAGDDRLE